MITTVQKSDSVTHTHRHTDTQTYTHTHTYTHVHTYTYIHTHTHTHTHIPFWFHFNWTSQLLENSREVFSEEWCRCLYFSRYVVSFLHVLLEPLLRERNDVSVERASIDLLDYSQSVDVMVLPQCVSDIVGLCCWGFQGDTL